MMARSTVVAMLWAALASALPLAPPAIGATAAARTRAAPTRVSDCNANASALPQPTPASGAAARAGLQALVREALRRSQAIGAARLLAEAAQSDAELARADRLPQASLSASIGPLGHGGRNVDGSTLVQGNSAVTMTAPLYDAGRRQQTLEARLQLAEAARQSQLSAQEQIALQTVSLALERSRLLAQAAVYGLYRAKMACLLASLEQIVGADRGRGSELVQARKSLQQVELAREDVAAQQRQNDVRLRRFVGDDAVLPDAVVLARAPTLPELRADLAQSADLMQLGSQANAQDSMARATVAGQKAQASWVVQGNRALGSGGTGSSWGWNAGLVLNIPLVDPGAEASAQSARQRALAARLQYDDALETRQSRGADTLLQVQAAADRAERIDTVLTSSQRVREDTLLQWQQLGRRSLFDVMAAEGDYYGLLIARVNAEHDGQQASALAWSLGRGVAAALLP